MIQHLLVMAPSDPKAKTGLPSSSVHRDVHAERVRIITRLRADLRGTIGVAGDGILMGRFTMGRTNHQETRSCNPP